MSEHARQTGDRECLGLLIGMRASDLAISEISEYIPLTLGDEHVTHLSIQEIFQVMSNLKEKDVNIVGWVHSHPKGGIPSYS